MFRASVVAVGLTLFVATACGDTAPEGEATVPAAADAGAEVPERLVGEAPTDQLDTASSQVPPNGIGDVPLVSVGGSGVDLFNVADATRFSDGRIAVADGSEELYLFDRSGQYLLTLGRRGQGPGEFSDIAWVQRLSADTLAVYDRTTLVLSLLSPEGEYISSVSARDSLSPILGVFEDGSLLTLTTVFHGSEPGTAVRRTSATFFRRDRNSGQVLDSLGMLPWNESVRPAGMPAIVFPGFHRSHVALGPRDAFVATGYRFEVVRLVGQAEPDVVARLDMEPRTLSAEEVIRSVPALVGFVNERDVALSSGQTYPATRGLLVDESGNFWVEEYPIGDEPPAWTIFDPAGDFLGQIIMPDGFRPLELYENEVLGVWRDELEVEFVQVRGITRGS